MYPQTNDTNTTIRTRRNRKGKTALVIILLLVIVSVTTYAVYSYFQNTQLQDDLSKIQLEKKTLLAQNKLLQTSNVDEPDIISDTLQNGKVLSYVNSDGNRNVLYWYAPRDANMPNTLYLSHKSIQQFLSTVDSDTMAKVCGTITNQKAIRYEISVIAFDVSTRSKINPQSASCLDALASEENTNTSIRGEAKALIIKISDDISQFVESVQIK